MALPKRPSIGSGGEPEENRVIALPQAPTPSYNREPEPTNLFGDDHDDTTVPSGGYDEEEETLEPASVFDELDEEEENEIEEELSVLPEDVQESVELLIEEILSDESSEVIMNGPDSIHCKRNGQRIHLTDIDFHDVKTYHHVINKFVLEYCDTKERISDTAYLVEGQLELDDPENENAAPMVARVHIVAPPAVRYAKVTIAKKARNQFTLDDIYQSGAMNSNMFEFLKAIARGKLTTVFSGLSGSGKTTLMEAMSYYFDKDDRVVVAEDTSELSFPIADVVYMVSSKPKPGDSANQKPISLEWLVAQANRMRPDRIIVGETRGSEMSEFLVAANSGADGSMTTLHAQDPERAWQKMANLASKAAGNRSEASIVRDIAGTVQIIVQMALIDGRHVITHITEVSNTINQQTQKIALNPIFTYDRRTGQWSAAGRPSEDLKTFMAARQVPLQTSWFQKTM